MPSCEAEMGGGQGEKWGCQFEKKNELFFDLKHMEWFIQFCSPIRRHSGVIQGS